LGVNMKCLNCNRELVKPGLLMGGGSMCAGERINTKWLDGNAYIECKHCKAKNFIEDQPNNKFTVKHFTID